MIDNPELFRKLAVAVRNLTTVTKTKTADTGKYKYTYASLSDVIDAVDAACDQAGITYIQPIIERDGMMIVQTVIIDTDTGEAITFDGPATAVKNDPQVAGSCISYFRRYALTSLFKLKVEDDDGGQAHRAVAQPGQRTEAEKQVRALVKKFDNQARSQFQDEFKEHFGSTLTGLPESKHGDALTFTKSWIEFNIDTGHSA